MTVDTCIYGRLLQCSRCQALVDLLELPAPWIAAETYVCSECLQPVPGGKHQLGEPDLTQPAFRRPEPSLERKEPALP